MAKTYRLAAPAERASTAPILDEQQQLVVDHRGGPMLVLAGPGTGKTTTIVEAVAQRIVNGELDASQVLLLTFSRKAADEMRSRVSARIGGAHVAVPAMTFHSYSYALVREFGSGEAYEHPATLITSQEREHIIRELIAGHDVSSWPAHLHQALATRGFSEEVQTFMDRVSALAMSSAELHELAAQQNRPEWLRLDEFAGEYRDVLALRNLVDYPGLIDRAIGLASIDENCALLRERHRLVIVDEYQDTDAMQVELLQQIAGDGAELIVVGDPDQSIYAFRGADQREILEFPMRFATPLHKPKVIALKNTRRFGESILRASTRILQGLPLPQGDVSEQMREHRNLHTHASDPGIVELHTFTTPTAEAESIGAFLRQRHIDDGIDWRDMAVLVRNEEHLTRLSRALIAAGVPIETAGDEVPLYQEPAVRHILAALELAFRISREQEVSSELAVAVLDGPIGGLDPAARRRIGRALRVNDPDTRSDELIVRSLSEPTLIGVAAKDHATGEALKQMKAVIDVLHRAARLLSKSEPLEAVVWAVWNGSGWPQHLRARWEQGGERRSAADRDLNAMNALFNYLAKAEEQGRQRSVINLISELQAHQIPADQRSSGVLGSDAVRLMTAHRSKGLEWQVVAVAGMQEGTWPNVRHMGSLLHTEQLDGAHVSSRGAQVREERRLFYVACTRAISRLLITAVDPVNEDAEGPSRFFSELVAEFTGKPDSLVPLGRPRRSLTLRSVIAQLRAIGENAESSEADRLAAAKRLAEIAQAGFAATRAADPQRWWGLAEWTQAPNPSRPEDRPVTLSASAVSAIADCPLKWFLDRDVKANYRSVQGASLGSVIHAIAKDMGDRELDPTRELLTRDEMIEHLDSVWGRFSFDSIWQNEREHERAIDLLDRLENWRAASGRVVRATEHNIAIDIDVDGGRVHMHGSIDRIDQNPDSGAVQIVDIKSGKSVPTKKETDIHPQLGFYQVAIEEGAAADVLGDDVILSGAELVTLGKEKGTKEPLMPKVLQQEALNEDSVAREQIQVAFDVIRSEVHPATPSESACKYCAFKNVCPTKTMDTIGGLS